MQDKTKLGTRYTCFQCGCKFYDLNRPTSNCPDCDVNQEEAPVQDVKALLSSGRRNYETAEPEAPAPAESESEEDDDDSLDSIDGGLDSSPSGDDGNIMGGGFDDE